jgi:hypothetical protein
VRKIIISYVLVSPILEKQKNQKYKYILNAYKNKEKTPCNTGIILENGEELIVKYSSKDRIKWSKDIIDIVNDLSINKTIKITKEDREWLSNGIISPGILEMISDIKTNIKDYNNKIHSITLEQMYTVIIKQHLQTRADLAQKSKLVSILNNASNEDELNNIIWVP